MTIGGGYTWAQRMANLYALNAANGQVAGKYGPPGPVPVANAPIIGGHALVLTAKATSHWSRCMRRYPEAQVKVVSRA